MDDKKYSGKSRGARFRHNDTNNCRFAKTVGKIVGAVLFASLSWNANAVDERFPGVEVQLDGLANSVAPLDSTSAVVSPPELGAAVSFEAPIHDGAGLDNKAANPELISLNVVDPAPMVPLDTASLEVVDTGTSKHVQDPQAVSAVPLDSSIPPEADELNAGATSVVVQQVRNYKLMLPATDVAQENVVTDAVTVATDAKNAQPDEIQGSTASEEPVHLPFAVLLAILALISMIPVARRNG